MAQEAFGTWDQVRATIDRTLECMQECKGPMFAVGNHMPANTPVDNCLYYNEVYEELAQR